MLQYRKHIHSMVGPNGLGFQAAQEWLTKHIGVRLIAEIRGPHSPEAQCWALFDKLKRSAEVAQAAEACRRRTQNLTDSRRAHQQRMRERVVVEIDPTSVEKPHHRRKALSPTEQAARKAAALTYARQEATAKAAEARAQAEAQAAEAAAKEARRQKSTRRERRAAEQARAA